MEDSPLVNKAQRRYQAKLRQLARKTMITGMLLAAVGIAIVFTGYHWKVTTLKAGGALIIIYAIVLQFITPSAAKMQEGLEQEIEAVRAEQSLGATSDDETREYAPRRDAPEAAAGSDEPTPSA